MDFIPAGRILRNAGRNKGSMLNCYHLGCGDSIEEIGQFIKEALVVWSEGGGCGVNMSLLRPKGTPILGKGGESSGMLSFLIATDSVSKTIQTGGQRRAAGLASLEVSHPEILDFIDAKTVHGEISNFNISIMINDVFLEAVEQDKPWELKFKQKLYNTIKAKDIWDKIIYNMIHHAEPGLLNTSNLFKNNSYYFAPISGVNPCLTGETLVAVADGRKHISIKQLAEEDKDVPVYSYNEDKKKIEVKMMCHPRITGYKQKILKITLDDGSFIRCTENHKFYMKDGSKKEASTLKVNDSLCSYKYKKIDATEVNINDYYFKSFIKLRQSVQLNYKIVSIEKDGYEDVYNGAVDSNHNFYIIVKESKIKTKKSEYNYILTPNCGEATLSVGESCCLGALVMPNFITGNVNTNWQKLEKVIKLAVRFLDNVLDTNIYTLRKIDEKTHDSRRIGLGIMGLADYLICKKLKYGSKEAISEVEKLVRFIRDTAYQASIELAVEKGTFPKFDSVMYGKASFIRKLPASLRMDIKNHGIRNVTLMSFAPTGTSSLLPECSNGIEPLTFKAYKRNDRVGERIYIHPKYKELLLAGETIPDWFVDSSDLNPKDHFETQAAVQKYVDGAVSKTANCPKGTTEKQLSNYLLEYIHDLKGTTVYVDGSREGQVYNKLSKKEALEILKKGNDIKDTLQEEDVECKGACAIPVKEGA
jgi:ribonucleotide reductase alpha subunit